MKSVEVLILTKDFQQASLHFKKHHLISPAFLTPGGREADQAPTERNGAGRIILADAVERV
ncbi:hypothetical protein MYX82_10695 [Acidobacteria bacterium AH-259-D05]|nr:hypothetical protein [Acidobacteria bacterium AH-259-D05]